MRVYLDPRKALAESRKQARELETEHDPNAIMEVHGPIGFVMLYDDMVRIKPGTLHFKWDGPAKLFMTPDLKGAMNFRYEDIAGVKLDTRTSFRTFELVVFGSGKPIMVPFSKDQTDAFEAMAAAIRRKIYALNAAPKNNSATPLDELSKLATLRDQGIVTEAEFQAHKKKLLGTKTVERSQKRFDPQTGRRL